MATENCGNHRKRTKTQWRH